MSVGHTFPARHARRGNLLPLVAITLVLGWPATPMRAADEQIIYPRSAPGAPTTSPGSSTAPSAGNSSLLVFAVIAAGAGGWFLWRQRKDGFSRSKQANKLSLAETRPLGNRQFLVVATYEDKKFLLGVCPGRIELLTRLDETPPAP